MTDWYVDNAAGGENDGTSWTDAWESFANIVWGGIGAGDSLYISGGSEGKTYLETLTIGASGSSGTPIVIKPGAAHPTLSSGHDGLVTIDAEATRSKCIDFNANNYITIDGKDGTEDVPATPFDNTDYIKLKVQNSTGIGIYADDYSIDTVAQYVHVYRCGRGAPGAATDNHGIQFRHCQGARVSYCDVEDAWQDGVKLGKTGAYGNTTCNHNWIHGMGDDGIGGSGGQDVYNNIIGPWRNDYSTCDGHTDGAQIVSGYTRIWNNLIYTDSLSGPYASPNALLFIDCEWGPMNHVEIYNNVLWLSGTPYTNGNFYGIYLQTGEEGDARHMDDIHIYNNTLVDIGHIPIHIRSEVADGQVTNCYIKNNIQQRGAGRG